jgi:SSS family solute:Na+ symporter
VTQPHHFNPVALGIFVALFALVTVVGFIAVRWRRAKLDNVNEWGLGGRRFGTIVTWFLLGGDLYTAYTFIAVPALIFGSGATGFFALPYTIIVYPLVFLVMPRLWSVCHRRNYVTPADFVRGRYSSQGLSLAVAFTGILATMPYIALQLVGIQVVLGAMGVGGDWPLIVAFAILAAYTYQSGLRAPALIALVKDTLIYATILVAVIYIPIKLGGFGHIFNSAAAALPAKHTSSGSAASLIPSSVSGQTAYATLALGSALALFLYPHALTGVLSAKSAKVIRRNAAILPAYSFLLGLIALLGYMVIAANIKPSSSSYAVPDLFLHFFPSWFLGIAFAAIAIGALVPAAVMSIAAANLFTRNIYKPYLRPACSDADEARAAKLTSLVVKVGALAFILLMPLQDAINFQLLGGALILQTLPPVVIGLYARWPHRWALLAGWAVGMATGIYMGATSSFQSPLFVLHIFGLSINGYYALWALLANLIVTVVLGLLFSAARMRNQADETQPSDYRLRAEEEPVQV